MWEILTVNELFEACKEQIALGNGDKHILLSDDDEGNNYHFCHFAFSDDIYAFTDPASLNMPKDDFEKCIILG